MPDDEGRVTKRIGLNELGRTGLVRMAGNIYEEYLPKLRGLSGVRIYKEMRDNSSIVGAMLFAVVSLMRQTTWKVEPASEETKDIEAAKFLEECRHDMSHTWEDFVSEILSMLVYGWSYFEIVYKQRKGPDQRKPSSRSRFDDNRIGWRKFAPRSQDTLFQWRFDPDGGIRGMVQQVPVTDFDDRGNTTVFLPIEKCLLFRTTSFKNNPEGRSVLRNAYRSYYLLKRLQEIEAIGAERNLAGLPIAYVPVDLLADDRSAAATSTYNYIKDIVTRTKRDEQEGIIFPLAFDEDGNQMYKFELLAAGGASARSTPPTREMITSYAQEIAMTIMADWLLLGHEAVGSFALSSDKTEMFSVALGAWMDSIEDTINRHAVPRLFELNDFDIESFPKVRHGDVETPNLAEIGAYVQQLHSAGAMLFPDLLLENHLREAASFPEIDPEEYAERLEEKQAQAMQFGGGGGGFGSGDDDDEEGGGPEGGPETPSPRPGNGQRTFNEDRVRTLLRSSPPPRISGG